jgi:hypothetical protein
MPEVRTVPPQHESLPQTALGCFFWTLLGLVKTVGFAFRN